MRAGRRRVRVFVIPVPVFALRAKLGRLVFVMVVQQVVAMLCNFHRISSAHNDRGTAGRVAGARTSVTIGKVLIHGFCAAG